MSDFTPQKSCNLVMKGGLTSGVVYPSAIVEIARTHQLHKIGGASAGAIAAAAAAAAEFKRQQSKKRDDFSGYTALSEIPKSLGPNLEKLFQPSKKLAPLFKIFLTMIKRKNMPSLSKPFVFLFRAIFGYWRITLPIAVLSTILFVLNPIFGHSWLVNILMGAALIMISTLLIMVCLYRDLTDTMAKHDFGLCSGLTQKGYKHHALTPWLSDQIDGIAYGKKYLSIENRKPLTVGDLQKYDISIAAMTTDLSSGRPYQLPFRSNIHFYSVKEFEEIFPKNIMSYLEKNSKSVESSDPNSPKDLRSLPAGSKMPVIMIARMSLSFPFLICAVPLYRVDYTLRDKDTGQAPFVRCLFSDGGISSNFPIHFFDTFLPERPTFGISLAAYDNTRHSAVDKIRLPSKQRHPDSLYAHPITTVAGFFGSILNTAKDWQDTLQSRLPGYADRIVTIRLDPKEEGGMNLAMKEDQIDNLERLGYLAGRCFIPKENEQDIERNADQSELNKGHRFDLEKHKFARAYSTMPVLEETLIDFAASFDGPATPESQHWSDLISNDQIKGPYSSTSTAWRKDTFLPITKKIASLGRALAKLKRDGKALGSNKHMAKLDAELRLVASAERVSKPFEKPVPE